MSSEAEELAAYSRAQKRRLARFGCAWCDHPLNQPGCGSIYRDSTCPDWTRRDRRVACLNESKSSHLHVQEEV